MSSSIEEQFQPPEWATKEEVIKAACHYINYWKIEARSRSQQWLDALQGESNAKRAEASMRSELNVKHLTLEVLKSARERDVAEVHRLKAEVERLTELVESNLNSSKVAMGKADAVLHERDSLKAEVERLRKAGDAVCESPYALETDPAVIEWRAAKEGKQS